MCGRFVSKEGKDKLAKLYRAQRIASTPFAPSHNVAPTEAAPFVVESSTQERSLEIGKFGIPTMGGGRSFPLMNLRSETVGDRSDYMTRRCVVPANGFYEWLKLSPKDRQPYYFSPKEGLFSFAGVWKELSDGLAFTILTTSANELVEPIHGRMPVILGHNAVPQWLSNDSDKETLSSLMQPYPAGLMQAWKVSKAVNSPKNKEAECTNSL
jgi:putative SOS response-associated peptidase YedK